jgi:hypothetical protein
MRRRPQSRTPVVRSRTSKSVYIENFEGVVAKNKIVQYRVNAKITFEVQ